MIQLGQYRLTFDQRTDAQLLEEQIIEDPERAAYEIVALRSLVRDIDTDYAGLAERYGWGTK